MFEPPRPCLMSSAGTNASLALMTVALLIPSTAGANPVIYHPTSFIAFGIVAVMALLVESACAALLLVFNGVSPVRCMATLMVFNLTIFLFLFYPAVRRDMMPLPVLEVLVVVADAVVIKLLVVVSALQLPQFTGVSWFKALVVSGSANLTSFFVGVLASGAPWEMKH